MIKQEKANKANIFAIYNMAEETLRNELQEKTLQLNQLTKDFEEFQETSKSFEIELEQEIENQTNYNKLLQAENDDLKDEIKLLKEDYRKKISEFESSNEKLLKELKIALEKLKFFQRNKKELEIDLEIAHGKLREKEYENSQLTEYYHNALEDLAITCSELDNLKDHNAETTQRLKDQLKELNSELEIIQQTKGKRFQRSQTFIEVINAEPKLKSSIAGKNSVDIVETLLGSLSLRLKSYQS